MRSITSHAARPHGRLVQETVNRSPIVGCGKFRYIYFAQQFVTAVTAPPLVCCVIWGRSVQLHLPSTAKSQLGRKPHHITIVQWNVRTLLDRKDTDTPERFTALVAMELAKYNIDIAVLSERRFHVSGSLNDLVYTFYWSGKPNSKKR